MQSHRLNLRKRNMHVNDCRGHICYIGRNVLLDGRQYLNLGCCCIQMPKAQSLAQHCCRCSESRKYCLIHMSLFSSPPEYFGGNSNPALHISMFSVAKTQLVNKHVNSSDAGNSFFIFVVRCYSLKKVVIHNVFPI